MIGADQIIAGGGTAGLIAFLVWIARTLWTDHQERDRKDRENLDKALGINEVTAYALKELSEWAEEQGRRTRRHEDPGARR